MNDQIFVSHSQHDKEIVVSFDRVFARTGIRSVCMEFEQLGTPQWKDIKNAIQSSLATFVLLGQNINRSIYTQNWVAFEVGVACATNKKVWVFQQEGSSVNFPIPYVTDFMLYDNLDRRENFDYVRRIIEGIGYESHYFQPADEPKKEAPKGKNIQCSKCKGEFRYHTVKNSLFSTYVPSKCPLCCQEI